MTTYSRILKLLVLTLTVGLLLPTTGMAQEETTAPPEDEVLEPSKWLKNYQCWCVTSERLATASFKYKSCALSLAAGKENAAAREKHLLGSYELEVKGVRTWCDAQLSRLRTSCDDQMKNLVEQTNTLVQDVSQSYGKRLKEVTGLVEPHKSSWYKSPVFWGITSFVVGGALGVGIGAMAWK